MFTSSARKRVDTKRFHALSQQANCSILTASCPRGDTDTHRGQGQRFLFSWLASASGEYRGNEWGLTKVESISLPLRRQVLRTSRNCRERIAKAEFSTYEEGVAKEMTHRRETFGQARRFRYPRTFRVSNLSEVGSILAFPVYGKRFSAFLPSRKETRVLLAALPVRKRTDRIQKMPCSGLALNFVGFRSCVHVPFENMAFTESFPTAGRVE